MIRNLCSKPYLFLPAIIYCVVVSSCNNNGEHNTADKKIDTAAIKSNG